MKIEYLPIAYSAATSNLEFDSTYDYCLYRQDWNGREVIYFDINEAEEILEMIDSGEITIHFNYSIVYCKDEKAYNNLSKDAFSCFSTIF